MPVEEQTMLMGHSMKYLSLLVVTGTAVNSKERFSKLDWILCSPAEAAKDVSQTQTQTWKRLSVLPLQFLF